MYDPETDFHGCRYHRETTLTLNKRLRGAITGLGIALISIPVALLVTMLLVPFWSWLEATSGIESLGHSGPAAWCYLAVYLLVVTICGLLRVYMANCYSSGYRELINPSAVTLPTEVI